MRWFDGHLDLAYLAVNGRDIQQRCADSAKGCVSLPDLRAGNVHAYFATVFTEPGETVAHQPHGYSSSDDLDAAERAGRLQLDCYLNLERQGELTIVRDSSALAEHATDIPAQNHKRLVALLLMEGADPIRTPQHVGWWHERGLRAVGMAWANGTRYAPGNDALATAPLPALGRELVKALDHHRIIHDVSHLNDAAFDAVMELARGPVMASHSNCRTLVKPNQRHLTDAQIAHIAQRNGMIGLNLYTRFLAVGRPATLDDCVRHIEHIASIHGQTRSIGLGSDMDGGFPPTDLPVNLDHPTKLMHLADALNRRGWSDQQIHDFAWGNWMRFLTDALQQPC